MFKACRLAAGLVPILLFTPVLPDMPSAARAGQVDPQSVDLILTAQLEQFKNRPPYAVRFLRRYQMIDKDGKPIKPVSGPFTAESLAKGEIRERNGQYELLCDSFVPESGSNALTLILQEHTLWAENRLLDTVASFGPQGKFQARNASLRKQNKTQEGPRPNIDGRFADGILLDSEHFSATLLRAKDRSGFEEAEATRIEGTTPWGRLAVWLDRSDPRCFVKAFFTADVRKLPGNSGSQPALQSYTFEVTVAVYKEIGRIPVAVEATRTDEVSEGSAPIRRRYSVTRSDFQVSPDFDAMNAFRFELPEGTQVTVEGGAGVVYEWRDGRVVPCIPGEIEKQVTQIALELKSKRGIGESSTDQGNPALPGTVAIDGKGSLGTSASSSQPVQHGALRPRWGIGRRQLLLLVGGVVVALACLSALLFRTGKRHPKR